MPRKSDPKRREQFEAAIVEHVRKHGFADLSLRTLASALGVSTFALVYHFGSKEGVVDVAMQAVRTHHMQMFRHWMDAPGSSPPALMRRYWDWWMARHDRDDSRLSYEVLGTALRDPARFPHVAESRRQWIHVVADSGVQYGLSQQDSETMASLMIATIIGLQIDFLATGDGDRCTRAIYTHADVLERGLREKRHRSAHAAVAK